MNIKPYQDTDRKKWDAYVQGHPNGTLYHLSQWRDIIHNTYGHDTHYLVAEIESKIVGVLPLVHLKHFIFGNNLISIPFFDIGGILADDRDTEKALLWQAIKLGKKLNVETVELRQIGRAHV